MNAERMWEAWRQALRASAGTLARTMLVAALAIGLGTGPAHADPAAESHYAAVLLATVQSTEKLDELVVDILATRLGPEKHAIARRMLVKLFTHPAMPAFVARTGAEWGSSPSASQSREAMEISVSILRLADMRRLAPEHQRQFIDQMASKLQHASEQVCHELRENRRGAFDSLEREHLRRIGLDEFAAFIRLAEMSALAELADEPKPANLSEEQLRRAGEAFIAAREDRFAVLDHDVSREISARLLAPIDVDCMPLHATYYAMQEMAEPERTWVIRAFLERLQ